jgi:hypothetical protein
MERWRANDWATLVIQLGSCWVRVNFREFFFWDCMKRPQAPANRLSMRRLMAAYTNASPLAQSLS